MIVKGRRSVPVPATTNVLGYAVVIYSDGGTKSVPLTGVKTTIGRDEGNSVVIHDEEVSGHHVDLYITEEGMYVVDAGSSNGTLLNGQSVSKAWIKPGDVIVLGATQIHIRS